MSELPTIKLFRLRESANALDYGTYQAACFDLSASFAPGLEIATFDVNNHKSAVPVTPEQEYVLLPHERALIPTGWVFGIPRGYSMRVHPRSGIAWKNGVTVFNCEGVIDSDYTHETYVMLVNNSTERFTIKNGDRIAQAELVPVASHVFTVTHDPITTTSNRIGGLGSTGV